MRLTGSTQRDRVPPAAGRRPQGPPARHRTARALLGWEPRVDTDEGPAAHRRLVPGEAPLVRVLVTGGAGFVGSHVVDRLLADEHAVDVVDNLTTGRRERVQPAARLHVCDLRDARLDAVFAAARPEVVVHVAAQAAVPARSPTRSSTRASTCWGRSRCSRRCRRAGRPARPLHLQRGRRVRRHRRPADPGRPSPRDPPRHTGCRRSPPSDYLECWAGLTGGRGADAAPGQHLRPAPGPRGRSRRRSRSSRRDSCVGEPVHRERRRGRRRATTSSSGTSPTRSRAGSTSADATGVANVGTGAETTVNELLSSPGAPRRRRIAPPSTPRPKPGEQRRSVLDASRAKALLGWSARTSLDEGLTQTVLWFRKELRA